MPATVQCQACSAATVLPYGWENYNGPWRCIHCQANHFVECKYGGVYSIRLEDRFAPAALNAPGGVASDVREAVSAYNAFAPRAAVVTIRRALERACNEKGASGDQLWKKIRDLHDRLGIFDSAHYALATATRHFGNFGAHPNDDLLEDLSDDDARRALDLGIHLISKIYP